MTDDRPIEFKTYDIVEMGWQVADRERNVWESPTGELRRFPPNMSVIYITVLDQ